MGKTKVETVRWSLFTGELAAVRVHTVVNATSDPTLGDRLVAGDLNWVQPTGSDELQQILVPVVYHDEERRIFALVLPEAFRARELEERAALLLGLAKDGGAPIPVYVVHFVVVFGEAGLAAYLSRPSADLLTGEGAPELARREDDIVAREVKLAEWEARLGEDQKRLAVDLKQRQLMDDDVNTTLQAELRRREVDIGRREAELREVERLVVERQAELERRDAALERREEQLRRQPMPAPEENESVTRVAHRESLELAAREAGPPSESEGLLEGPSRRAVGSGRQAGSALDDELREAQRELQARLGKSFKVTTPDLGPPPEEPLPEDVLEEQLASEDTGARDIYRGSGGDRSQTIEPSGGFDLGHEGDEEPLPEVAAEPGAPSGEPGASFEDLWGRGEDTGALADEGFVAGDASEAVESFEASEGSEARSPSGPKTQQTAASPLDEALLDAVAEEARRMKAAERAGGAPMSFLAEEAGVGDELSSEVPALPEELTAWYESESRGPRWYLSETGVHLAVCLPSARAEAFVRLEPAGLVQLHGFESFAWITIAVVAGPADEASPVIHWPLDVRDDRARALLDRLASDFRFALEIYDDLLEPVTSQELHYPLEENVRIVRERAQRWMSGIAPEALDPVAAWNQFEAPGYPRLEPGAPDFGPSAFQQLGSAREVALAVGVVARWSTAEKEDELLLRRSFPAATWRSLRLRVLRTAIEYGIWMDADLRRLVLDAGYATSKRDLLRACLSGFERVGAGELGGGLDPVREHENWRALLEEAERLGVAVEPRWDRMAEEALARAAGSSSEEPAVGDEAGSYTDQLERLDEDDLLDAEELREHGSDQVLPSEEDGLASEGGPSGEIGSSSGSEAGFPNAGLARGGSPVAEGAPLVVEARFEELPEQDLMSMLSDPEVMLGAALELCQRGERRALPDLFGLLPSLERSGLLRIAPPLLGFGADARPLFSQMLRSPVSHLRIVAALALGALGADEALDGLIDLLLDEPTESWRSVASVLGDSGRPAMMSLASRIRHSSVEQRVRIAAALAEVSLKEGCRELLLDLSGSRDEEAAMLAVDALRQAAELRMGREGAKEPLADQPMALFNRRLVELLAPAARESEEGDFIEAEDVVEEGDVVDEGLLPEETRV